MNPGQGSAGCGKSESGNTEHHHVLHFLQCYSRFFRVANGGMGTTFCSRSDGKRELDKPPRFLVERIGLMTGIGERGKALPKFRMRLYECDQLNWRASAWILLFKRTTEHYTTTIVSKLGVSGLRVRPFSAGRRLRNRNSSREMCSLFHFGLMALERVRPRLP